MTQEEAIEVVKKNYPHVSFSGSQFETALRELVPELTEIEDEKIRKALVWHLKADGDFVSNGVTKEECITYLEKQKEQNLELYYDKGLDSAAREFYFSGGADSPVDSTGLVPIVRMAEFGATWMKKKMEKEQKPAEWSEEDETKLRDVVRLIEDSGHVKSIREHYKKFLTSLPERFNLHPEQWSEEDEDMRYKATAVLNKLCASKKEFVWQHKTLIKIFNWLKSLPLNLKKKNEDVAKLCSNEWSEEDEKDIAHIIRILDDCYVYGKHDLSKTDHDNLVNKLKSLHPQWKPSEGQMDALAHATMLTMPENHEKSLESLYEQLKKLM